MDSLPRMPLLDHSRDLLSIPWADFLNTLLEQVLARGANSRLATALADLARELGPANVTRRVQVTRHSSLRHAA